MNQEDVNARGRVEGDNNLLYAAIHPFPLPGWKPSELVSIHGSNWQVIFNPDGADYIDIERGGKIVDRHLNGPDVMISGVDGLSDPAQTMENQKPIIDAIRGLILLAGPAGSSLLLPPVWEGILKKSSPNKVTYEVRRTEAVVDGITQLELREWGDRWKNFNPVSSPSEISFGLRWYYKGMIDLHESPQERIDAFVALWICVITIVRAWHAQNVGGDPSEMSRFIEYATQRLELHGDDFELAKARFQIIRDRRNKLFKGGGAMAISDYEASTAAQLARLILEHEVYAYT